CGSFIALLGMVILAFAPYGFGYWFNHGQAPHSSRISPFEIVDEFFTLSEWIKFYLFLIVLLLIPRFKEWKEFWNNRRDMLFFLLTLAILGEAAIFQVTSYTPPDNNIFFHSFALAFLLSVLANAKLVDFSRKPVLLIGIAGTLL